mgnify:CR=1 FL=1
MLMLQWIKCTGDNWCNFIALDLQDAHFNELSGVYVIWHGGTNPHTVRIGQGNIRDRLNAHRNAPEILAYQPNGLYVTWARLPANQLDGVEAFLANQLQPLIGERFPDRTPIEVNLPR